jgi:hypothetical protein
MDDAEPFEMRFDVHLQKSEKVDMLYFNVPFDVERIYGTRGRVPVLGTMNGIEFRSSIFADGEGNHRLMVGKALRKELNVKEGDAVNVIMRRDTAPRTIEIHPDLQQALKDAPRAIAVFDALTPARRKEYITWVGSAKRDETRRERIARTIAILIEGRPVNR